jgi:hypothetical protein
MAKNLLHCETGFGVYRSTQLGHIPFFLLLYLLVGPSIERFHRPPVRVGCRDLPPSVERVPDLLPVDNWCR